MTTPPTSTSPPAFDYLLGSSVDVSRGDTRIVAVLTAGLPEEVSFSVSGAPAGTTITMDPESCAPPCVMLLEVDAPAPPVRPYRITVTGTPLGRTASFTVVPIAGLPCPATEALAGAPNREGAVGLLRDFRDRVLAATPEGRRYIDLFYRYAPEAVWLMLRHGDLRVRVRQEIEGLLPTVRETLAGQRPRLSERALSGIEALISAFRAKSSARLATDLDALARDLREPAGRRAFGLQ